MIRRRLIAVIALLATACVPYTERRTAEPVSDQPNFLIILADDLGFSDLGSYGSEIRTPNLDRLALEGVQLIGMRASPLCSPTRGMLLTGVDNHRTGQGNMYEAIAENQIGKPGYEGYLNRNVATLPEILRASGYRTYMSGKWNLGFLPEHDPINYGFERSFAMLNWGAGNFYGEKSRVPQAVPTKRGPMDFARGYLQYTMDGKALADGIPEGTYATDVYVDQLLQFMDQDPNPERPFFAYLAFTAPHVPIQVPDPWLDKYAGVYDTGPEAIRAERIRRQTSMGLLNASGLAAPMSPGTSEWKKRSAEYRAKTTRVQEVYAAQIEYMDAAIGRLRSSLEERGLWENTIVVFLSDNGSANSEASPDTWYGEWVEDNFDNSLENIGRFGSEFAPGPFWAQVGSAPFRKWKYLSWEGGIRVPTIFAGPGVKSGVRAFDWASVMDIAPTFLEAAGVDAPATTFADRNVFPIDGKSLWPTLQGAIQVPAEEERVFAAELDGLRSVIQGEWKIVLVPPPRGSGRWELYNLARDPGETNDLSGAEPERLQAMLKHWDQYVLDYGVIVPEGGSLATW
jgi:arylsulfatase